MSRLDLEAGQESLDATNELVKSIDEREELEKVNAAQEQLELEEYQNRNKPHATKDPKDFGVRENLTELKNALVGGVRDTGSSILTAPERIVDMASGEMAREMKEEGGYEPDWNPLSGDLNPETKTWWGALIRGGVHYGTMAIPIVGWAGATAKGVGITSKIAKATVLSQNVLIRGASVGAVSDLFSEYSQDANGLAVVRDRFGFIDTPLSTKDSDHPAMMTLKNVVEGLGIGILADFTVSGIANARAAKGITGKPDRDAMKAVDKIDANRRAKAENAARIQIDNNLRNATRQKLFNKGIDFDGLDPDQQLQQMGLVAKADRSGRYRSWNPPENNIQRAGRKILDRIRSVNNQITEKGKIELNEDGFRGHKNKPIGDPWQGAPTSTGNVWGVSKQLRRIDFEWGSELGSTDSLVTPAAAENLANNGLGKKGITPSIAREIFGDARFKKIAEELEMQGKSLQEGFGDAYNRMQEIIGGRDAGELSPEDFWRPILNDAQDRVGDTYRWSQQNVLAADLITSSLFKQLRDRGITARELMNITDVTDIDSSMKYIRDNLIVGLEQMKRSQFLVSDTYKDLVNQRGGKQLVDQALGEIHTTVRNQVDMMTDLARQSPTDDFLHAVLEAFSMSNKINNWQDFDNFMHNRLLGVTTEDGIRQTGALIKELQGVMMNSILSGPKTPLRAIMGTSTAVFTRPMSQVLGGLMRYASTGFTDAHSLKQAIGSANAMVQTIPEATEYFFSRLNSYWNGDISTIKNRFSEYKNADEHWDLVGHWAETRGTVGEKAAYRTANLARAANQNNFLTYSTKLMAATDDAFTMILARARAKEKAMQLAWNAKGDGLIPDLTPAIIKEYESRLYGEIFDPRTGVVKDDLLKYARGEATLTKDISGFGKSMDELFSANPALKPFYLFARTGINGLELSFKHIPGLNFFVKEFNDIAWAKPDDLSSVAKYGITNPQELINAKALQNGRLAMGSGIIFMAGQHYLNGGLTGNGPVDISQRRVWESAGWKPRSIKLGDVWVSYDSLEPFSNLLAGIADIGDNQKLMGPEWAEKGLLSYALLVSRGMVTKTYLQGFQQVTDLFGNNPKQLEKIAASIANNQIPLAGLRNEIGRVITPNMRELQSGFWDQIRNRNLFMEQLTPNKLPIKYSILNGNPIKDWDVPTRMFNAISPIQINFDQSPGQHLLFRSNYDLVTSTLTAPDGTSLRENPEIRSLFQQAIGKTLPGLKLDKLSKDPKILASIAEMEQDLQAGRKRINPMSYYHNKKIKKIFDAARKRGWASISSNPDVMNLIRARQLESGANYNRLVNPSKSRTQFDEATNLLEMTNR
tara:strand:- start:3968 stop:7939 length:3972 start_codon:yes stop_codon:yes gene_type:complete